MKTNQNLTNAIVSNFTDVPVTVKNGIYVMSSRDLHKVVFEATGKFAELNNFHKKVKKVLVNQEDSILELAEKLPNGQVHAYYLNEIQCNMVMASIDLNHLELISTVFVNVKNNIPTLSTKSTEFLTESQIAVLNEKRFALELNKLEMDAKKSERQADLDDQKFQLKMDKLTVKAQLLDGKKVKLLKKGSKAKADMVLGKLDNKTRALTFLLNSFSVRYTDSKGVSHPLQAKIMNKWLDAKGYINQGTEGWYVTSKGAFYGRNANPNTKAYPHWYVADFHSLLDELSKVHNINYTTSIKFNLAGKLVKR